MMDASIPEVRGFGGLVQAVTGAIAPPDYGAGTTAYQRGLSQAVTMQSKIAEAQKKRTEALQLQRLPQDLEAAGLPADRAQQIGAAARAGLGNFQQLTAGSGNLQEQSIIDSQLAQAAAGGSSAQALEQINLGNLIRDGKPAALTRVDGNTVYNPLIAPTSQQVGTTPYGQQSLSNRARADRYRTDTAAETQRGRASYSNPGRSSTASNQADQAIKAAARDAYYEARQNETLPDGVTIGDVEHQFRKTGQFVGGDGKVLAKYAADPNDLATAVQPNRNGPTSGQPSAESDLAAAATQARKKAAKPTDPPPAAVDAQPVRSAVPVATRIEQAKRALAGGADPAEVRTMLGKMGINPARAGL